MKSRILACLCVLLMVGIGAAPGANAAPTALTSRYVVTMLPPPHTMNLGNSMRLTGTVKGAGATKVTLYQLSGTRWVALRSAVLVAGRYTVHYKPVSAAAHSIRVSTLATKRHRAGTSPSKTVTVYTGHGASKTTVTNLNPLTPEGALRTGWTIVVPPWAGTEPVSCEYDQGSPSAVSPGTHRCGSSADSADACWTSTRYAGRILCLSDPFGKVLFARWAVNIVRSTPAPAQALPIGVELFDGTRWRLRNGGAWGGRKDNLNGAYSCRRGAACDYEKTGKDIVLLADSAHYGSSVDTSTQPWTVRVGEIGDPRTNYPPPKTVKVRKAFFITTR